MNAPATQQGTAPAASSTPAGSPAPSQQGAAPSAPTTPPGTGTPAAQPQGAQATPPAQPPRNDAAARLLVKQRESERRIKELEAQLDKSKGDLTLAQRLRDPKTKFQALAEIASYEEYTQHVLSQLDDGKGKAKLDLPPEVLERLERAEAAAKKLSEREAAEQKANEERSAAEQLEARRVYVRDTLFKAGGEAYALSSALGAEDLVLQVAAKRVEEGRDLDDEAEVSAVLSEVEKHTEAALGRQLEALLKTSKGRALVERLLTPPANPGAAPGPTTTPSPPKKPGLSNVMSSEPTTPVDYSQFDSAALRKRAIERMRNTPAIPSHGDD